MYLKAYFFSGDQYVRYDLVADKVDEGYPKAITEQWRGLTFTDGVDAALLPNNGKAYFFRGAEYVIYDIATDRADGPLPIDGNWPGIPFTDGVDAAVLWNNGKAYFFKGGQYIRYDIATGKADAGYPKPIAGNWPGVPFTDGIDAAVLWNNGKAYFFKGNQYVRYDLATDNVDAGYPQPIAGNWPGITFSEIRAPIVWTKVPVLGQSQFPNVPAVSGQNGFGGPGVQGESNTDIGVLGESKIGVGAEGRSQSGSGVFGQSKTGAGVLGQSTDDTAAAGPGVRGISKKAAGVLGESGAWHGVAGLSQSSTGGAGVYGKGLSGNFGVLGESTTGAGVEGRSQSGPGVFGQSITGLAGYFKGDVEVTGDVRLANADCAEDFDIVDADLVKPGTVMVVGEEGALHQSHQAYDKRVAGVISGAGDYKPGIVLDKQQSQTNRKPIALLGKVFCKVDAKYGAIEVGDLLTTSDTPGYAMKADNPFKAFGAVIGKALQPLKEGQGLIPILIALQ